MIAVQQEQEETGEGLGCKHYKRACLMQCPSPICAGKFYPCRLCHDEVHLEAELDQKKNHQLDRFKVTKIKCLRCGTEQEKSQTCIECKEDFAEYFCEVCCLYDNKGKQKKVFHCEGCGICRVGGRENFFHCDACECCLGLALKENHKCKKAVFKQECPICMMDM